MYKILNAAIFFTNNLIMEQFENIKLYNADCMDVMRTFKDKQFDLAIVDPPYFKYVANGTFYGGGVAKNGVKRLSSKSKTWDENIPNQEYYKEVVRVSKNQIVWGINYFDFTDVPHGRIVWDKINDSSTFSNCEIASCSLFYGVRIYREIWNGMIKSEPQKRIHPTQKPVALYKWLLQKYAKQADTILDTHFGSLSIGIACHDMGFDLTAIELDKEYYEKAKQRLIWHQQQQVLFKP